jgi:hypothetical protein
MHLILCKIWQGKDIREGAGERRREYEGEGGAAFTDGVRIVRGSSQVCRCSARNFVASSQRSREGAKGEERGEARLFIAGLAWGTG